MKLLLVLLVSCYILSAECDTNPVVQIQSGKVSGVPITNKYGTKYYAFKGIPYAKPPIGSLRFKPPEAVEIWEGTRDGKRNGQPCLQYNNIQKVTVGDEDCLFVNVYVPELPESLGDEPKKAVMVYIHGGGFFDGSGDSKIYGAGLLMEGDVIVVTFNYRLNVFGFLSTGDKVLPGNYGMQDQVLALKWVQENIEYFHGDASKVTIFGESAGSVSVSLHILSSSSKGLFQQAIMQSGSAFNAFGIQENPKPHAKEIASRLKCPTDFSSGILECLQKKKAKDIIKVVSKYASFPMMFPFYYTPVIESGENGFLTERPELILEKETYNKVPTMSGIMGNEAAFFIAAGGRAQKFDKKFYDGKQFEKYIQDISDLSENVPQVVERIKKEYFGEVTDFGDKSQTIGPLHKLTSSVLFNVGAVNFTKALVQQGRDEHYFYVMKYMGKMSLTSLFGPDNYGASHGDDLLYLFDGDMLQKLSDEDLKMARQVVTMWTNFAKNGVPFTNEVKWTPVPSDSFAYLEIDKELTMRTSDDFYQPEVKLWSKVLPKISAGQKLTKDEL